MVNVVEYHQIITIQTSMVRGKQGLRLLRTKTNVLKLILCHLIKTYYTSYKRIMLGILEQQHTSRLNKIQP